MAHPSVKSLLAKLATLGSRSPSKALLTTSLSGAEADLTATQASWPEDSLAMWKPPDASQDAQAPTWAERDPARPKPRTLGGYVMGPLLGSGGMGDVHQAWDPSLRRRVALKVLHQASPGLVERFRREAQLQARVDHPGICQVYAVSQDDDQPFIAMQLIHGPTLDKARGYLGLEEMLRIFEEVAGAIQAAHDAQLVHRDLKPGNIMLERTKDGAWKPYVMDFGLARDLEGLTLTKSDAFFGTPAFMPPEQAKGGRGNFRSDVYSLGATYYAILTGHPPIQAPNLTEVMRQLADPVIRPLGREVVGIPWELDTIVMKCLEHDPQRRYGTARELAEDLRRLRMGEPIQARRPSLAYRARKVVLRHKALSAVTFVAFLAVTTALGFLVQARRTSSARAYWAQHFGQEAERIEARVRYIRLMPLHDVRAEQKQVQATLVRLEADARAAGTLAEASAAYATGRGYLVLGDASKARARFEAALKLGFTNPSLHLALGRALGEAYQTELDSARRIPDADLRRARVQALERDLGARVLRELRAGRDARQGTSTYQEGLLAFYEGRLDEAVQLGRRAQAEEPWFYEGSLLEGQALLALAQQQADPALGREGLRKAGEAFQRGMSIAPSDVALRLGAVRRWREEMALAWKAGGDPAGANREALRGCEEALLLDPDLASILVMKGWVLAEWGRHLSNHGQDASGQFKEALGYVDRLPKGTEGALGVRAFVLFQQGLNEFMAGRDPARFYSQADEACTQWLLQDPRNTHAFDIQFRVRVNLLEARSKAGKWSMVDWERCRELVEQALPLGLPGGQARSMAGYLYYLRGDFEAAHGLDPRPSLGTSIEAFEKAIADDPHHFVFLCGLADSQVLLGDHLARLGEDPLPLYRLAMGRMEQAAGLNPGSYYPVNALLETHLKCAEVLILKHQEPGHELALAESLMTRLLKLNPKFPMNTHNQARILQLKARGRLDPALRARLQAMYERSCRLDPQDQHSLLALADLELDEADRDGNSSSLASAEARLATAANREPGSTDPQLAMRLARCHLLRARQATAPSIRQGEAEQARRLLAEARRGNRNMENEIRALEARYAPRS